MLSLMEWTLFRTLDLLVLLLIVDASPVEDSSVLGEAPLPADIPSGSWVLSFVGLWHIPTRMRLSQRVHKSPHVRKSQHACTSPNTHEQVPSRVRPFQCVRPSQHVCTSPHTRVPRRKSGLWVHPRWNRFRVADSFWHQPDSRRVLLTPPFQTGLPPGPAWSPLGVRLVGPADATPKPLFSSPLPSSPFPSPGQGREGHMTRQRDLRSWRLRCWYSLSSCR